MNDQSFSFLNLIPDFGLLSNGNITSSEGISALFCSILILVFASFLLLALFSAGKSLRKILFHFRILKNITKENLVSKREQIKQDMSKNKSYGALWKEFDQTLVYSTKETKLFNTVDADYFFNTSTLANGISNSRMMAAVPSFLTAIGVLGTFTGLQLGIGGLDLDSQNTEVLKHGIASVVHGASIAFTTSVWGVFLSLIFNFIEKGLEAGLQNGITNLQEKIDHLFPRINPEQSLIDISNSSKSSEEVLMGLAEKIGNTMQKAVSEMGEHVQQGMKQSMREIMGPGIDRLVGASEDLAKKQADGSQQFLQDLIGKFTEGLGAEGKRQQELMASTSGEVKEAMSAWGNDMNTFLARLETQFSAIEEESRKRNDLVEKQLQHNSNSQKENAEKLTTQLSDIMTRYATDLEKKHENMTQTDAMRQKAFEEQVAKLNENQSTMMTSMEELIGKHTIASKSVIAQGVSLGKGVMGIQTSLKTVSTQMESAGENLHQAAMALQKTTDNVNQSNATLTGAILDATRSNTSLSNQNREVASEVKNLLTSIISLKEDYTHTTDLLKQAAENADSTFDHLSKHQEDYRVSLKKHIDATMAQVDHLMKNYAEQMDEALTGYAEQLNDALANYGRHVEGQTHSRMQAWDKETQNYTSAMLGVVQAMEALVDDMDVKNAR